MPEAEKTEFALGLVETRGLICAIVACDAMLKTSAVHLVRQQITRPALVTILIEGEIAAVQSALDAGIRAAERVGPVISSHLIARPDPQLRPLLKKLALDSHLLENLEQPLDKLTVPRLRALARRRKGFPLTGREISKANRATLLEHLLPNNPPQSSGSDSS